MLYILLFSSVLYSYFSIFVILWEITFQESEQSKAEDFDFIFLHLKFMGHGPGPRNSNINKSFLVKILLILFH